MPSIQTLTRTYKELSSLYKNPTRALDGCAASNLNRELVKKHLKLLKLFRSTNWSSEEKNSALYVKVLALLFEVDDYRGVPPAVNDLILEEAEASSKDFQPEGKSVRGTLQGNEFDYYDLEMRSLWKAKVTCAVGAVESKRKDKGPSYESLPAELHNLEMFVEEKLHRSEESFRAWTTLAMVRTAQARLARQNQDYTYMREKLLSAVICLDERAAEIIGQLSKTIKKPRKTAGERARLRDLEDDLVFIRQKQTLSISFNVGLAELQRGFLRRADYACKAARLQFNLHGQFFHRLFNDLVLLSIRRARTSGDDTEEFLSLERELQGNILSWLRPTAETPNPKLYLYALRELAVVQIFCDKTKDAMETLDEMAKHHRDSAHWAARIFNLRARALYRKYRKSPDKSEAQSILDKALEYTESAFKNASYLKASIQRYKTSESLLVDIQGSTKKNLIETGESLISYGTVQLFRKNPNEALKSAAVAIELCRVNNPRLLAMGHLVAAEACKEIKEYAEAYEHLEHAKVLEIQVDHTYVGERRRAIEKDLPRYLDLKGCTYSEAEDRIMGWLIERSSGINVHQIAKDINVDRKTMTNYLRRLQESSPFFYLKNKFLDERGRVRLSKTRKHAEKKPPEEIALAKSS